MRNDFGGTQNNLLAGDASQVVREEKKEKKRKEKKKGRVVTPLSHTG